MRGGPAGDLIIGGLGADRITERNKGRDRIRGGPGTDVINARGGGVDIVACNKGRDRAVVDRRDLVSGCEVIVRGRAGR